MQTIPPLAFSSDTPPQDILAKLAELLPFVHIARVWSSDTFPDWDIFEVGNALDGEDKDNWQAWQSEVKATAIIQGKVFSGSNFLGGTWERYDDNPEVSNPSISGYFTQMVHEAIFQLVLALPQSPERETVLAVQDAFYATPANL